MLRYRLVRTILSLIQLAIADLTISGQENVPQDGPYIVVLNHVSVADTPVLLITFPVMKWRFFAVEKWRRHWLYGPIMSWLGAIYVPRDSVDRHSLRVALQALKAGTVFGLAPEGSRSSDGRLKQAKHGAAYLAASARVPVLPVGLVNMDVLFANARRWKRTQIVVNIGRPFQLPLDQKRVRGRDLEPYTHFIMVHVAALLPARYHGYYADSPALRALQVGRDPWPDCKNLISNSTRDG